MHDNKKSTEQHEKSKQSAREREREKENVKKTSRKKWKTKKYPARKIQMPKKGIILLDAVANNSERLNKMDKQQDLKKSSLHANKHNKWPVSLTFCYCLLR